MVAIWDLTKTAKTDAEAARNTALEQMKTRTITIAEIIATAKETAEAAAVVSVDILGLATDLLARENTNNTEDATPIESAVAAAFCGGLAAYNDANISETRTHNEAAVSVRDNLISARKNVDLASVIAKQLDAMTWNELRVAEKAYKESAAGIDKKAL